MSDVPRESPRTILFQFVIFPLGIVLVAVAIFLLFGKLATSEQSIPDYLNEIRSGSSHERWQAAYQLSKSLKRGEAKRYPNLEQQVASIYVQSKNALGLRKNARTRQPSSVQASWRLPGRRQT